MSAPADHRDPATRVEVPSSGLRWTDRLAVRTASSGDELTAILALAGATGIANFSGGFPAPETFPTELLGELTHRLVTEDAGVALQYTPSEGLPGFRAALADHLGATQGVRPADGELMVTSGGIDAVTLIAKSLVDPGDVVVVEDPTYLGAVTGFTGFDADVRGLPVDSDGLDVGALADLLATGVRPKVLYLIPDHQNPTGRTLSADRRPALVELCRRHGVLIVEDVAYRELGFDGTALPSLHSLAPDTVVQIGTFSKILFPGIRLGWAAGPAEVVAALVTAKQNADQCAGALGQRIAEEVLRGGHLPGILDRSRALYASRGVAVDAALRASLPEGSSWTTPRGGFFSWVQVPGVDLTALAVRAREVDVAYIPGEPFFARRGRRDHLRLSFSRVTVSDIESGLARLGTLLRTAVTTSA